MNKNFLRNKKSKRKRVLNAIPHPLGIKQPEMGGRAVKRNQIILKG